MPSLVDSIVLHAELSFICKMNRVNLSCDGQFYLGWQFDGNQQRN